MNTTWKLAAVIGCALFPALLISRASAADEPSTLERGIWQKHRPEGISGFARAHHGHSRPDAVIHVRGVNRMLAKRTGYQKNERKSQSEHHSVPPSPRD